MIFHKKSRRQRSQGAMEYLIIIAAVLIVAAVTTMLVTGTVGEQREDVLIEQCRSAATQCELQRRGDPDADCDFCEEQCVDQEGEEIFEGAIDCCKLGMDEEIYIGSDGCGDLIEVTADFSHDPLNPTAGSEVEFTDQSTVNHPDYDIVDWEWDFGDGGTSSQQNPTHTYDSEGTYTVELQVWDEEGNTDTTQETLEVSEYVYLETDYEGEGEIDVDPPDIEGRYEAGTEITLTAEPYELEDYYLYEWKDAEGSTTECIGEDETCTFTIEENSEITAVFLNEYYKLSISSSSGGTVDEPGQGVFPPAGDGYKKGTEIDLEARSYSHYNFDRWTGDTQEIGNRFSRNTHITMHDDYYITAEFEPVEYDLTINVGDGEGTTSPSPGTYSYEYSTSRWVDPDPDWGYEFDEWEGDCSYTSGDRCRVDMSGDREVTAHFESADDYTITNCEQLQLMKEDVSGDYELANDIDCSETEDWNNGDGFYPVGESPESTKFTGSFDGNDYIITDLHIDRPGRSQVGLFGHAKYEVPVENVGVEDVYIIGDKDTGGLIGRQSYQNYVDNAHATGTVEGNNNVGGLIGHKYEDLTNSWADADVSGNTRVGCVVGWDRRGESDYECTS